MNENERYVPPFTITDAIVGLVADIAERVGTSAAVSGTDMNPRLRRENRIKTIQASLSIENNSLSLDQVSDIIGGKRVLLPTAMDGWAGCGKRCYCMAGSRYLPGFRWRR